MEYYAFAAHKLFIDDLKQFFRQFNNSLKAFEALSPEQISGIALILKTTLSSYIATNREHLPKQEDNLLSTISYFFYQAAHLPLSCSLSQELRSILKHFHWHLIRYWPTENQLFSAYELAKIATTNTNFCKAIIQGANGEAPLLEQLPAELTTHITQYLSQEPIANIRPLIIELLNFFFLDSLENQQDTPQTISLDLSQEEAQTKLKNHFSILVRPYIKDHRLKHIINTPEASSLCNPSSDAFITLVSRFFPRAEPAPTPDAHTQG